MSFCERMFSALQVQPASAKNLPQRGLQDLDAKQDLVSRSTLATVRPATTATTTLVAGIPFASICYHPVVLVYHCHPYRLYAASTIQNYVVLRNQFSLRL